MKIFYLISNNLLLNKALNWIIENSSSHFLPYHNLYHLLTVTEYCYEGSTYYNLSEHKKTHLLLAALFHDVNYPTERTWKDAQKIALAVEALYQFKKSIPIEMVPEKIEWQDVEEIIHATEFPHKHKHNLPITHQIIQDADLMQIFSPNAFLQVILGLSQETNTPLKTIIEMQKDFLYNIKWNTEWAKNIFEEKISSVESQLELWRSLYSI